VNRSAIVDLVYGGVAQPAYGSVYGSLREWKASDLQRFEYDPQAAAKLLGGLGYRRKNQNGVLVNESGFELRFDLMISSEGRPRQIATIISVEAQKIGVAINVRFIDQGTQFSLLDSTGTDRSWDSSLSSISGGSLMWPFSSGVLNCNGRLHDTNRSGACLFDWERKLELLGQIGAREPDGTRRRRLGYEIQRLQSAVQDVIYTVSTEVSYSWRNTVRGEYPEGVMNATVGSRALELAWLKR
jgi:peptide/nickel transport system substrate-binding protein